MKHIEEEIEVCKRQIEIFSHVLNMYEDTKERLENELRRRKGFYNRNNFECDGSVGQVGEKS